MDTPLGLDGAPQSLDPRTRTLWAALRAAPLAVLTAVGALAAVVGGTAVGAAAVLVLGGMACALAVAWAGLVWRRWSFAVHPDALELRHGVMVRHTSLVPYHRIQQIDVTRSLVERMVGLSTLVLRTASATTDATLPGIGAARVDDLRVQLLARSGLDDAV